MTKYNHPDAVNRIQDAREHHVTADERQVDAATRRLSATLRDCGHKHTDAGNERCYAAEVTK